jgi:hypothetical protein
LKTIIFLSIVSLVLIVDAAAQVDRSGFSFGIGVGSAYSLHAGSYSLKEPGSIGSIENYGGFRILTTDIKLGWGLKPRVQVFYTFKYAPSNTTVSPYLSMYQGLIVNFSFKSIEELMLGVGAGINQVKDKDKGELAQGALVNLSIAYEFIPHFLVELNTLFGKMNNTPPPLSFLNTSTEFSFAITVNYLFYQDVKE